VTVAQRGEVGHDDEEEALRALLSRELQELAEAGILALAVGVEEGGGGLEAVLVAELHERLALFGEGAPL